MMMMWWWSSSVHKILIIIVVIFFFAVFYYNMLHFSLNLNQKKISQYDFSLFDWNTNGNASGLWHWIRRYCLFIIIYYPIYRLRFITFLNAFPALFITHRYIKWFFFSRNYHLDFFYTFTMLKLLSSSILKFWFYFFIRLNNHKLIMWLMIFNYVFFCFFDF